MNIKIMFGIIAVIIALAGIMGMYVNRYIQDSIQKGVQKEVCENMLETQNKAIQAQSIDTKKMSCLIISKRNMMSYHLVILTIKPS